ncbi:hypothetical protein CHU98_g6028 [Xylaria longipes]|nr:hypothetical protein CHU98_g6028 [Xylaria longipes]
MPSSKGKPTDPELREQLKEGEFFILRQKTWSALLKVSGLANKLAKEYEKQGGSYENEPGSKNEPRKGKPQAKSESKKEAET